MTEQEPSWDNDPPARPGLLAHLVVILLAAGILAGALIAVLWFFSAHLS